LLKYCLIFSAEIKEKNESFGTSLLLANIGPNSPMSPKIVDGSFAALFDNNEVHFCSTVEGEIELKLNDKVVFGFWTRLFFYQKGIWDRPLVKG
jgi:hypothetical protein